MYDRNFLLSWVSEKYGIDEATMASIGKVPENISTFAQLYAKETGQEAPTVKRKCYEVTLTGFRTCQFDKTFSVVLDADDDIEDYSAEELYELLDEDYGWEVVDEDPYCDDMQVEGVEVEERESIDEPDLDLTGDVQDSAD